MWKPIIILTKILVGGAWNVVSGFVGSAAHLPPMVRSGVVATESDSASTTADSLVVPSSLGVGTSLHGIEDGFLDGRNIILGQVLLPVVLVRSRLTTVGVLSLLS